MNICVTGVNPVQTGHRPKLDYVSSVQALKIGLEQAGHTVDLRPVVIGESFVPYDRVIVFMASMRGFICVHTLGALWAVHAAGDKCTISFDDWQVRESMIGIKCLAVERDKIVAKNPFGYKQIEQFGKFKEQLWSALDALVAPNWAWPVLVPGYHGGDLSLLSLPQAKVHVYNPSVLFKGKYGWAEPAQLPLRTKQWVLAALHDHRSWLKKQKLALPVLQFGHRKQGQERLPESTIYDRYAQYQLALSPAYKIAGSGWWRARYGFTADALSVIAGSPAEMAMVSPTAYAKTPQEIEVLSDTELLDLAVAQREAYYTKAGTVEQMQADILASFC